MIFITHHRKKGVYLPIPSLEERSPEVFMLNRPLGISSSSSSKDPESVLAWFREDPLANAHHEHWHIVYPHRGIPDENNPTKRMTKDRQGELFFYMHQQMLARYDTERIAVGLEPVKPLSNYSSDQLEGYDPNLPGYSPRPNGIRLADVNRPSSFIYTIDELEKRRTRLLRAAIDQVFDMGSGGKSPVNANLLGATEEASIDSISTASGNSYYGSHHNFGHVMIAYAHDPMGTSDWGVMATTPTAIRDPVFYRWHRDIDDLSFQWQERQKPNDFSDAPEVVIRKSLNGSTFESKDIILAFKDKVPGSNNPEFNWYSYADETFGENNWDEDFSSREPGTNQLETMMLERDIHLEGGLTSKVNYLDQREFVYFIRAENPDDKPKDVTVRIYLAAISPVENRRMWIELDKFRHRLGARQHTVIFRPVEKSSVIKKPASKPPRPVEKPNGLPGESYCPCGWPYNLLIPRGTKDAMPFRLMVMLTDWEKDRVGDDSSCGSMSYCGARDRYPDVRGMGYPFDRPFPNDGSITQTINSQKNMAARDITIRWMPTR